MTLNFKKSFLKELKKLKDEDLKNAIHKCILEVEKAKNLNQIKNLKKLTGYSVYYRIKIGDYRIGVKVQDEIVNFVVFEHRKDIYKGFP